jgi:hypothetical protein
LTRPESEVKKGQYMFGTPKSPILCFIFFLCFAYDLSLTVVIVTMSF